MNPFVKDIITIGFSTVSLVISLISLGLAVNSYRRSGSLVELHLKYERYSGKGGFALQIENEGYHSIRIIAIRMITDDQVIPVQVEKFDLEYGQEKTISIPMSAYAVHPLEVTALEAVDIADKVYRIRTKHLKHKIMQAA